MRHWGKNIVIDGTYYDSPLAKERGVTDGERLLNSLGVYEERVQDLLRTLAQSRVGKVVVGAIERCSSRQLRIVPMTLEERFAPKSRGAYAVPTDFTGSLSTNVQVCTTGKTCYSVGTGKGSDVVLNYEPYSHGVDFHLDPQNIMREDDVLLHELVHCLRMMRGMFNNYPIDRPLRHSEEVYAIVIANMYRAEIGRTKLRGNYDVLTQPLPGNWKGGARQFYYDYQWLIDHLWINEMHAECWQFACMSGFWNPFAVRLQAQLERALR